MAGEVCELCGLPRATGLQNPLSDEVCKNWTQQGRHICTGKALDRARAQVMVLEAQLKAAEAGLRRAWAEGQKAGFLDHERRIREGTTDGKWPPLTDNPYPDPKVNHADD